MPVYDWLDDHLGFIPFFAGPASATGRTILTVGIVLAIMILPIITAISREVFLQTPRLHEEAALALGATRWEMIRIAVLPYAPLRHRLARRCSASAAPSARPWRSRWCSRSAASSRFNLISIDEPGDDRGEHRAEVRRGHRRRASTR